MSNLLDYAKNEFKLAGWLNEDGSYIDPIQSLVCTNTLSLLRTFSKACHSGTSAQYSIELFTHLAQFKPLTPLTGEDSEWMLVGEELPHQYQNKRLSSVFKNLSTGEVFDVTGIVFYRWGTQGDGTQRKIYFTNSSSSIPVKFPYTQIIEYREVK